MQKITVRNVKGVLGIKQGKATVNGQELSALIANPGSNHVSIGCYLAHPDGGFFPVFDVVGTPVSIRSKSRGVEEKIMVSGRNLLTKLRPFVGSEVMLEVLATHREGRMKRVQAD